jgi:RNA-directed DNA polymerase
MAWVVGTAHPTHENELPLKNELFTLENLYQAYRACRRHKRGTINALRFEAGLLGNLCDLRDELVGRTYHPTTSICFVQRRPKLREIFAADFRDRVVHHLLVGYLEPLFERQFIHDSYACRKQKGVHAGVTRLREFLHRVTGNGTVPAWYLKEDISGFFMNIDKEVLYNLVCRRVKREDVRWLARQIIFHDCTGDYHFKGKQHLLGRIPPHKTLFRVPSGKGLPIGNLTSQFFANVYLNELDQYVKRSLHCHYYLRYCDDFLLLGDSPEQLQTWRDAIAGFVRERLLLQLNQGQHRLRPVANGIDFLGYVVRRRYVLVRRRVVNHFRERLEHFQGQLVERGRGQVTAWRYPPLVLQSLRAVVASYLGHLRRANSTRLVQSLFRRFAVLRAAFLLRDERLVPRYLPAPTGRSLHEQYRGWVPAAPRPVDSGRKPPQRPLWVRGGEPQPVLVFFPVGRFYEFYESQAECAHEILGLKLLVGLRGFCHGCGFHWSRRTHFLKKALESGRHVALIKAEKRVDGTTRRRLAKLFRGRETLHGPETVGIAHPTG